MPFILLVSAPPTPSLPLEMLQAVEHLTQLWHEMLPWHIPSRCRNMSGRARAGALLRLMEYLGINKQTFAPVSSDDLSDTIPTSAQLSSCKNRQDCYK